MISVLLPPVDLAVVPIFVNAGAALLPAIIAGLASVFALIFKPRELFALFRRKPQVRLRGFRVEIMSFLPEQFAPPSAPGAMKRPPPTLCVPPASCLATPDSAGWKPAGRTGGMPGFRGLALLATWAALLDASVSFAAPRHVYLTWQGDTSTTMTVNFQTLTPAEEPAVFFRKVLADGAGDNSRVTARSHQIPGLPDGRWIHVAELKGLEPGATYHFTAGDHGNGFCAEQKFQTIPAGNEPLRFVNGGDMGTAHVVETLLAEAAKRRPEAEKVFATIPKKISVPKPPLSPPDKDL